MWDRAAGDMCLNMNRTNLHTRQKKIKIKNPACFPMSAVCFLSEPRGPFLQSVKKKKRCVSEPRGIVIMNIDPDSVLVERHCHKGMNTCMNSEGDRAHVYLLKLSVGSRVLRGI